MKKRKKKAIVKKLTLRQRFRRFIYGVGGVLFVGALWYVYTALNGVFGSTAGRAATWGAGAALSPLLADTPWYMWGGCACVALYLWTKHKWIGSAVAGVVAGVWLAL